MPTPLPVGEGNLVDAGLFMRRSFGVAWSPIGLYAHTGERAATVCERANHNIALAMPVAWCQRGHLAHTNALRISSAIVCKLKQQLCKSGFVAAYACLGGKGACDQDMYPLQQQQQHAAGVDRSHRDI